MLSGNRGSRGSASGDPSVTRATQFTHNVLSLLLLGAVCSVLSVRASASARLAVAAAASFWVASIVEEKGSSVSRVPCMDKFEACVGRTKVERGGAN